MSRCTLHLRIRIALCALAAAGAWTAAADPPRCAPVSGVEEVLRAGTILLVGEMHGTVESPAFALDLACQAVAAELPVILGIEISDSERARFEAFLASPGDAASRAGLFAGEAWQGEPQYGVTSEAMLGLLEGLRQLRQKGGAVRVVLFNQPPDSGSKSRDRKMANYLAEALADAEDAFTLVLTGNVHSRVALGTRWDPGYEPMGYLLRRAVAPRRVVSLDVAHGGGSAWVCLSGEPCGARDMGPRGPAGKGITWNESEAGTGHHGWYHVGSLTASPPAAAGELQEAAAPAAAELLWQHDTGG